MAFATANVSKTVFGNMYVTKGDWTGSAGDAPGTIGVEGGRVYVADFNDQSTNSPVEEVPVSTSTTGGVTTVTVYNHKTVSTGRFLIIHA